MAPAHRTSTPGTSTPVAYAGETVRFPVKLSAALHVRLHLQAQAANRSLQQQVLQAIEFGLPLCDREIAWGHLQRAAAAHRSPPAKPPA